MILRRTSCNRIYKDRNISYICDMKKHFPVLLFLLALAAFPAAAQRAQHIQHKLLDIPAGEYSGITRTGDDTYMLVHDKKASLFVLTLELAGDGSVGYCGVFETQEQGKAKRDNEDIVYVPERKRLFVCAEGDQSIREYRLDGRETGRKLVIPKDLTSPAGNRGFEALAYANGTFWATTESPLPGAEMHILQSFSLKGLQARSRYLYQAEKPQVPAPKQASAQAYVSGISAMTVLPDGQLAVLEREVYVPGGTGALTKLLESFTETRIYVVSPADGRPGKLLEKTLLTSFRTSALNLANFEGMCLGPVLEDGRQTLLLIADSQNGSGGLTGEYLRVIALEQ